MINVTIGNTASRSNIIVSENTTLRAALEQQGIDYSIGMTSLDGATLKAGELDKTFADFGITEKCYLLNVVKADNAAKIKVAGSAVVVESDFTVDDLKTIKKYRPDNLTLYKGEGKDKEPIFAVGLTGGAGSINKYGAAFATNENGGKATVTMVDTAVVEDPNKYVEEKIGVAILNLNKLEATFPAILTEIADELEAIRSNITVM